MRLPEPIFCLLTVFSSLYASGAYSRSFDDSNCVYQTVIDKLSAYVKATYTRNKLTYPTHKLKVVSSDGAEMGYVQYGELGPHDISIEIVKVPMKFKGRGISKILLASVLKLRPDTQSIFAMLEFDNLRIFKDAIKNGLSEVDSLRSTPMYKAAAGFGYSRLVQYGTNGKVYFILEKP